MSSYTKHQFRYKHLEGIDYELTNSIEWELLHKEVDTAVIVPQGFIFNVSIPFWVRWVFSPHNPKYLKAACLHDYLLKRKHSKALAAAVFYDALKADNVTTWRRWIMFLAVISKTVR